MVTLPERAPTEQARKKIIDAPGRRAPLTAAGAEQSTPTDTAGPAEPDAPPGRRAAGTHPRPDEGRRNEPTKAERPAAAARPTAEAPTGRPAEGAATGSPGAGRAAATTPAAQSPGRTGASPGPAARHTATPTHEPRRPAGRPPAGRAASNTPGQAPSAQAERRPRPETERAPTPRRGAHDGRTLQLLGVCAGLGSYSGDGANPQPTTNPGNKPTNHRRPPAGSSGSNRAAAEAQSRERSAPGRAACGPRAERAERPLWAFITPALDQFLDQQI